MRPIWTLAGPVKSRILLLSPSINLCLRIGKSRYDAYAGANLADGAALPRVDGAERHERIYLG